MEFGLTVQGFKRKRYADIVADKEARAKVIFGEDVNLDEKGPLGKFIRLTAWEESQLWELAEDVWNSGYKDTAEGVSLGHVGKYIGISKKLPTKSVGEEVINGDAGTEIPAGFLVAVGDVQFETTEIATIPATGTITVPIQAVIAGASGNVPAGTITKIVNPTAGITSVTNPAETRDGTDAETDPQFKDRYDRSVAKGGSSTAASIEAALLELENVRDAIVDENGSTNTVNGIPAKSVAPFVFGGDDNEIAKAIFSSKAGGIQSYGDVVVTVVDSKGRNHSIGFSRPTYIDVWVNVNLTTDTDFPTNGNELVRTEIIKHIGGLDVDAADYDGLGLGKDVIVFQVSTAIGKAVPGITDIIIEFSTDGINFATSNISIGSRELARTDYNKAVIA